MATKKEEAKGANVLEGFWENTNLLEKAEQSYLQMLESQKQWIETANDQVTQWEDNAKKITTDWKHIVQDGITNNTKLPIDTNSLNNKKLVQSCTSLSKMHLINGKKHSYKPSK